MAWKNLIEIDASHGTAKIQRMIEIIKEVRAKQAALGGTFLKVIEDRTPKKTGDTRNSWTLHVLRDDIQEVRWSIRPDGREKIVEYLEYGTRPHIIVPKVAGGVLVFEVGGETVFSKLVHHPGTKPLGIVRITRAEVWEAHQQIARELHVRMRSFH